MAPEINAKEIQIDEYESQPRKLTARTDLIVGIIAISLSLFQIYTSWIGPFENLIQRSIHIGLAFTILFAIYPPTKRSVKRNQILWTDWIIIGLSLVCTIWVILNTNRFIEYPGDSTTIDLVLGGVLTLLILEGARRVIGPPLPVIAIIAILYALFGHHLSGQFAHKEFSIRMIIDSLYTSSIGIWGLITGISASLIAGFLIFGVMLEKTGGGETFVDLALKIAGRSHGGPAKVSCFSSAFFGTISGSAIANVVVDGVFNIPLMKSLGYKKEFAGAVEATTSTGGQLMPPVMGAGAFIMAEILGIPYARVAIGAAIPALLFYWGCYWCIHFEAQRLHLKPLTSDMIPSFRKKILPRSLPFFLPVSILVYLLAIGYNPPLSVLYSLLVSMGWHLISVRNKETFKIRLKQVIVSLDIGGRTICVVAALCACAQIVVCMINMTGIGVKLCELIIGLSHGYTFMTLFLGMFICLILGMGIPTTAAYILASSVIAPAITSLGGLPLSAHLFIFYFAIIAAITPPVCGAVYVASAIAQSNWWKTGWIATRLGLSGFIIPFVFFYSPSLLLYGKPTDIVINSISAFMGVGALSAAVMGFFLKRLSWIERLLLCAAGFLLVDPRFLTDITGLLLIGGVYINQKYNLIPKTQEKGGS